MSTLENTCPDCGTVVAEPMHNAEGELTHVCPEAQAVDYVAAQRLCVLANQEMIDLLGEEGVGAGDYGIKSLLRPTGGADWTGGGFHARDYDDRRWYSVEDGINGFHWSGWITSDDDKYHLVEYLGGPDMAEDDVLPSESI